jgi:hypothetical protein
MVETMLAWQNGMASTQQDPKENSVMATPLMLTSALLCLVPLLGGALFALRNPKLFWLVIKNLFRNRLRTGLTTFAITVLVLMITLIWIVVDSVDVLTHDRSKDLKLIVAERWRNPSMMPLTHAHYLTPQMPQSDSRGGVGAVAAPRVTSLRIVAAFCPPDHTR